MKKYITTTLPYLNSAPHIGHAFEFVIADIIAEYYRHKLGAQNVFFNVGVDEHGQKIFWSAQAESISPQEFCDRGAISWDAFCWLLKIRYDNFYRTTAPKHHIYVKKFFDEIKQHTFEKDYTGKYCIGCESYVLDKELMNGECPIHKTKPEVISEKNVFFDLAKFAPYIKDIVVNEGYVVELDNLLKEPFDLSITRQNVEWGVPTGDGKSVFYVWFDALLNYLFAIKYYEDSAYFKEFWENSLIICGKDNLKFQAFILQGLLRANDIPQTKEILVHGMILDSKGQKMSKTIGNVVDPVEQVRRYGADPLRYYLAFGLNTYSDSKYSEEDLRTIWNADIVDGFGNLIARMLHLIDLRKVDVNYLTLLPADKYAIGVKQEEIENAFTAYDLKEVRRLLNEEVFHLNKWINDSKPYSIDCADYAAILNTMYWTLSMLATFYRMILKDHRDKIGQALADKRKAVLFKRIV